MTDDESTKPTAFPPESSVSPWLTPSRIAFNTQFVTIEEAVAMLPDSDMIPTLMQVNNQHFTADWRRNDLIAAMKQKHPQLTGPRATAAGYRLAIAIDEETDLYIKTRKDETP